MSDRFPARLDVDDFCTMSRRTLLRRLGAAALLTATGGLFRGGVWASPVFAADPFSLGIAAGDPAPDGFVIAFGRQVAKGDFPRASVVDVVPTVLYYFGLPIARDLDGFARTDIFTPEFTGRRPITFIPVYDR